MNKPRARQIHGRYCAAVGCLNNQESNPSLAFYRFTKQKER